MRLRRLRPPRNPVAASSSWVRPIRFAITRYGRTFEGQVVPMDPRAGRLAHTAGEALALRLWQKMGVGDDRFPGDLGTWWAQWARTHRLPPPQTPAH
jgi:hypothetical protein